MPLLFSVVPLRKGRARVTERGHRCTGYLRSEREGACIALTVISYQAGIPVAGPLYDARIIRADQDGIIVQGIERVG